MTDKEKITAILKAYTQKHNISASSVILEEYAEELLANGVIVLPVPIGSTVYEIRARGERAYKHRKFDYGIPTNFALHNAIEMGAELYVAPKKFTKTDSVRLNKTVFLTKEEAEANLDKRGKEND